MELVKPSNGSAPPNMIKLEGEIKFSQVGLNQTMEVRGFVNGPQGKQYVCRAFFEYIDPQMVRSLLKFGEEGRQTKYGNIVVTGPR